MRLLSANNHSWGPRNGCLILLAACSLASLTLAALTPSPNQRPNSPGASPVPAPTSASASPSTSPSTPTPAPKSKTLEKDQAIKRTPDDELSAGCQYEKSPWSECQTNGGEQTRTLTLISEPRSGPQQAGNAKCPKVKVVRRQCKQGCKYIRGDWLPDCVDGQRVRIDTLLGRLESPNKQQPALKCEPQRRVTKDCRRACHYVKSAWSECANGFKTRELRLEDLPGSPPVGASSCAKHRQIKRECQAAAAPTKGHEPRRLAANRHQSEKATPPTIVTTPTPAPASQPRLTLAQKRRLKQLQRQQKQQQQQQQLVQNNNNNNKSI